MVLLSGCMIFNVIAIIAFAFIIFYLYFKYCFNYWKKLRVPYLEPSFPFGNGEEFIRAKRTVGDVFLDDYNKMKARGHKFYGIYMLNNPVFVAIDPELIKTVMSRDFGYFNDRGIYYDEENDPLSASLFSLKGQKWKNLRAKLTPTFTSGKLKKMFQTLVDCSVELKDCLNESICKGEPIDIKQILAQYTTDVIGSCAFGIECNSFKNPGAEFIKLGKKIGRPDGFDKAKMFFSTAFPKIAKFFKMRLTNKDVDIFYRKLVKDTVEYREKNNITRNDFLQLLIQLKNEGIVEDDEHEHDIENKNNKETEYKFTMNVLSAQAFLFFTAGYETTSTAMTWVFYELAQNPTVQNTLRAEIVHVLKKYDGKITYDAIMEMHYMDRVIQEALRKYPALMVLQRITIMDYAVPDTDIVLKKGTGVLLPIYGLHKDPEYYPDPEKFDPDRFTEENKAMRPDYTWLPFGDGPRICIGLRFAMMQLKVGLCQLLLNYKFTLNSTTANPPVFDLKSFVTSSKNPILLDAEKVAS